ncbi:hypothetical protein BDN71DRAFT_1512084 [Pleurotus eryngii]|uniref:Uncharacterized protein n=1 Tax=Pleurotus eryngii TaxID=5323 RepID=A0A9P6D219_PLEER|nr:hypothetical protein BDN71DRAFT_1512084 [Pleurotus eryngii]
MPGSPCTYHSSDEAIYVRVLRARFSPGSTVDARDCSEASITASSVNVSSATVVISKTSLTHGRPLRPLSKQSKARPSVTAWVGSSTGDCAKCAGYILPLAAFLGNLPPSSATAQRLPAHRN